MWKQLLMLGLSAFSAMAMAAVDVNTASAADLDSVKGIGPSTSAKILDARKAGPFKSWEDLMQRVGGIGAARANKLSGQGLRVNGNGFENRSVGTTATRPEKTTAKVVPAGTAPARTSP